MMSNDPIVDAAGRFIAPPQTAFAPRAAVYTEDGSGEHVSWCPCERCERERDEARRERRGADVREALAGEIPLVRICAWCPDFDPTAPINAGATHGICPACEAKFK